MITFFKNHKHNIKQFLKLSLISGMAFIIFIFISVALLAWIYRDTITERFIARINKGLQTQVYIDNISMDFFRHFPLAAISLKNVTIHEISPDSPKDTLLYAQRVYFRFSIIDIIRKDFSVRQAEIVNGQLNVKYYTDGTNNYSIWKSVENGEADEFEFQIRRVVFNSVLVRYSDFKSNHFLSFDLGKTALGGNFTNDSYLMSFKGDMNVVEVVIDNEYLLGNQKMVFDFDLDVLNNNRFTFRQGTFNLGSHLFLAQGMVDISDEDLFLDLQINAQQLKLGDVIADLPPQYSKYFEGFRSNGKLYLNGSIKGTLGLEKYPSLTADFGIDQGELIQRRANLHFKNISFTGSVSNGSKQHLRTSLLDIKNFKATLNDGEIKGDAILRNFLEPEIDAKLFSNISAGEWQKFLQVEKITQASGELVIDVEFKGKLGENRKFTAYHFMASRVTGLITTKDLNFRLANDPLDYNSINGDFQFNNNDIMIKHFEGRASSSDFKMQGYFRNVLPWLFFDNERLFVNASLVSQNLNFNELLQFSVNESDTTYRLKMSEMIDFRFQADIDKLSFRKFYGEKVKGKLAMREQVFYANDFSIATMKGNIVASGYINGRNADMLEIGCEAKMYNVDVYDLFYQMGNFGQQSIDYENLRGRITADARFISMWSPFLDIDWNSLDVTANVKIENGELINYKPMLALARFIRVGDLNQVKFSTLENQIRIKNQKIIIPDMEINSNAINIKLSGEHTFENQIDYRLQVLLSDLLARRNRESRNPQEQYGDIIDDGLGRTTLFLRVTGTIDEPEFKYDFKGVREKLREDIRREGQTLRQVFRTEFGIASADTLPAGSPQQTSPENTQREDIKRGEKGKFTIEWED